MRKTESRIQRTFEGVFGRTFKGYVQPAELAQKLVKEMDESRVDSPSRSYAPNIFTVYLCRRDRDHFRPEETALVQELEAHLLRHARAQRYDLVGPPEVSIASDDDLKLGFFGIRTEPVKPAPARPGEYRDRYLDPSARPVVAPPASSGSALAAGAALGAAAAASVAPSRGPAEAGRSVPDETQGITAQQARELRLARRVLVLNDGRTKREFQQGRIVLGRARETDFQVDDANVSRQHAALYWEDDRVFVKDLGSTNGTYVNGRPVTAGPVVDGDVLTLGSSKISVHLC